MYRYLDATGVERPLANEFDLAEAIKSGKIRPSTPMVEGPTGGWMLAERHPAYRKLTISTRQGSAAGAGWLSRRTVLAAAAAVVVGGGAFMIKAQREDGRLMRSYEEALLGLSEGRRAPPKLLTAEPPADRDAKLMWIRVRAEDEVVAGIDSALAAHGITTFDPPAVWLTQDYFRDAGRYPDVATHWEAYNRFHATHAARIPHHVRGAVSAWSGRAGVSPPFTNELTDRIETEMQGRMRPFYTRSEIAGAALDLHLGLARSTGRVLVQRDGQLAFQDRVALNSYQSFMPVIRRGTREMAVFTAELGPQREAMLNAGPGVLMTDPNANDRRTYTLPEARGARREPVAVRPRPRRPGGGG